MIRAYHEYKSDAERDLAERVAEQSATPITHFRRDDHPQRVRSIACDPQFILSAGLTRPSVLRWTMQIERIRQLQGEQVRIIGLNGSDPHKGLYYSQIVNLERHAPAVLAPGKEHVKTGLRHLGLTTAEDFYTPFVRRVVEQSRSVYDCHTSRLDFVFYHVVVVNNNGNRSRLFRDLFGNLYPTHNPQFMNIVFSLPRSQKENARFPERLIRELDEHAASLPYISANTRKMAPKPGIFRRIASKASRSWKRPHIKGRVAKGKLVDHDPQSALTAALKAAARSQHPLIGQADAIIAHNYFSTLEQRLGTDWELV